MLSSLALEVTADREKEAGFPSLWCCYTVAPANLNFHDFRPQERPDKAQPQAIC